MSLHAFPSFLFLSCCCHPNPGHHQHVAVLGLSSSAWCFKGSQSLAQSPYLGYSHASQNGLQVSWKYSFPHLFSLLTSPGSVTLPVSSSWSDLSLKSPTLGFFFWPNSKVQYVTALWKFHVCPLINLNERQVPQEPRWYQATFFCHRAEHLVSTGLEKRREKRKPTFFFSVSSEDETDNQQQKEHWEDIPVKKNGC